MNEHEIGNTKSGCHKNLSLNENATANNQLSRLFDESILLLGKQENISWSFIISGNVKFAKNE